MRTRGVRKERGRERLCMVSSASPEGEEVQVTLHQSGNDPWPFGFKQTVAQLHSDACFSF